MPDSPPSKLSLSKVVVTLLAAVAIFLVLRFVFSVAMSILKFVALGALVLFVVWLFIGSKSGGGAGKTG